MVQGYSRSRRGLLVALGCLIAVLLAWLPASADAALKWHLRDSNSTGPATIPPFYFGNNADTPVTGDWVWGDGSFADTVGLFQPGGYWRMRYSNSGGGFDKSVLFGQQAGDKPVAARWGNWNMDMPGIVRGNQWLYPSPTGGSAINLGGYGNPGDRPFASGDQLPLRLVVRPQVTVWRWFVGACCVGSGASAWMDYGNTSHIPVFGDWNGDGTDTPGVYIPALGQWHLNNHWTDNIADIAFAYGGPSTARPVTGDWNGDGIDTIGLVIPD